MSTSLHYRPRPPARKPILSTGSRLSILSDRISAREAGISVFDSGFIMLRHETFDQATLTPFDYGGY